MLFVSVTLGASLKDVSYSVKQNGIMVNIDYTEPISDDDIIGWKSDRGWLYLTLLGVRAPNNLIPTSTFNGVVKEIVLDDFDESIQVAILVGRPIVGYDIVNSPGVPTTVVFIHTEMKKSEIAYLKEYIENTLEKPREEFGGLPACPFVKKERVSGTLFRREYTGASRVFFGVSRIAWHV